MFGINKQYNTSLKHPRLVFGIIAVVCLELGFTTFMTTSDLRDRSSLIVKNADARIGPVPIRQDVATIRPEDVVVSPVIEDTVPGVSNRTQIRNAPRRVKTAARPEHFAEIKKKQTPAKIKPSKPADTYALERKSLKDPQKEDLLTSFRSYEVTTAEASLKPKSEKRSLIASALPIVKKPYSWIKALGSKLF